MNPKKPFTVAIVNSKGGVAKTTTAVALAQLIGSEVGPTTLIDLDRQGSAAAWALEASDAGKPLAAKVEQVPADLPPARLARVIDQLGEGAEWLIIDTPPGDLDRIDAAIEAVAANGGVAIVPTATTDLDLPRAVVTVEDIGERAKAIVLLTKTRANTKSLRQARSDLAELGMTVLEAEIPLRESISSTPATNDQVLLELYEPVATEFLELVS